MLLLHQSKLANSSTISVSFALNFKRDFPILTGQKWLVDALTTRRAVVVSKLPSFISSVIAQHGSFRCFWLGLAMLDVLGIRTNAMKLRAASAYELGLLTKTPSPSTDVEAKFREAQRTLEGLKSYCFYDEDLLREALRTGEESVHRVEIATDNSFLSIPEATECLAVAGAGAVQATVACRMYQLEASEGEW